LRERNESTAGFNANGGNMKPVSEDGRPLELERKYLIEYPDPGWLDSYPGSERIEILQTYFDTVTEEKLRVRIWRTEGATSYILTKKTKVTNVTRIEEESEISKSEYDDLLARAVSGVRQLSKIRYRLPYEGRTVEVDMYPFWDDRAIAEVELESEEEYVKLPEELKMIAEVTEDKSYTNYNLAAPVERSAYGRNT